MMIQLGVELVREPHRNACRTEAQSKESQKTVVAVNLKMKKKKNMKNKSNVEMFFHDFCFGDIFNYVLLVDLL